jgi:cell division protein FtsQ
VSAIASALSRPLGGLAALAPSPRLRRRLIATAAACVVLAAVYMAWFRDSGLVKVERVTVTGVTTRDSARLREALAQAGRSMTTLHVDQGRLERAVAGFPVVRELKVSPDFPNALSIEVVEHHPAAIAIAGATRVAVAGDGTVLRGLPVDGRLPELHLRGAMPATRLREGAALRAAHVLGGAPGPLLPRLLAVRDGGDKGLTVTLREGPDLIFGDSTRLRAKWIAAARVLADPSARGATYIDVRLPDRPAAGGVAGLTLEPVAPLAGPAGAVAPPVAAPGTAVQATPQAAGGAAAGQAAQPQAGSTPPAGQAPAQQAPAAPAQPQAGTGGGATANPQP